MATCSNKLPMIGLSLADLIFEVFCFAAAPSFRGATTIVSKARQAVKDASSSSPELARDRSDLGKRVTDALTTKVKAAREQCLDRGIDTSLLAQAETAVAALLSTDADQDLIVLSAVRDPEGFIAFFMTRAAKHRQQIDEQAEPYFDALVRAVAAAYVEIAPWSDSFVVIALKSLLGECTDIKEQLNASQIENRQLFSQILQILQSLTEAIEDLNKPSYTERVNFGSRPDVVAGDRFIERDEHEQLKALITDPKKQRTVLVGMRGCGKTQLAASLAKQCEDANWNLVAWINAVSRESIQSDLVELAKQLGIGTSDQPTQDQIIQRFLSRVQSAEPADRLIVFDNVEDINHLTGLIPSGDGVRVIATTTNDTGWEHQDWTIIKVGVFDRSKSINYLLAVTKSVDHDAADALAERLGDLPLAIAQAAATARHKDLSLARYLNRLKSRGEELVIRPIPGDEYTDDVATVLWMAIEAAVDSMKNGTKQMARRQLGALALLAESGVPTRWLDPTVEQLDDDESPDNRRDTDEDAHDALTELIHKSIVQQSADGSTIMLHRLQARTIREEWIETQEGDLYDHAAYYLTTVNDPPTGGACSNNQHHVGQHSRDNMEVLGTRAHPDSDELHPVQEKTLGQIRDGLVLVSDLSQFEAELRVTKNEIIEQLHAISIQKHSRAQLHRPDVAKVLSDTLEDICYLEMPHEAEKLATAVEYVCATGQRDCGLLPIIRKNYALALQRAGRVHEAVDRFESLLEEEQEKTSSHSSITLTMRSTLALAYQNSGQTATAITLLEEILHEDLTTISHDAEISLIIQNSLALAYQNDGRLHDSLPLLERNLDSYRTLLGKEHHHTQIARNNLAYAYRKLGRFDDSLREFEIALSILKRHQQNHQHTLIVTENYALTLRDKGREENDQEAITTAIITLRDCLERHIDLLSLEHPYTLTARNNLADALLDAGRTEESIELHRFNLREHVRVLGPLHPYSLTIINNLASALFMRCKFSESISFLRCCIREYRRILGPDHHEVLVVRNTLATVYRESGSYPRALDENRLNLSECQRLLSPDAPQFMFVLNNLALTHCRMGTRKDAITEFNRILGEYTECYGKDHILVTTVQSVRDAIIADMACFE